MIVVPPAIEPEAGDTDVTESVAADTVDAKYEGATPPMVVKYPPMLAVAQITCPPTCIHSSELCR